MTLLAPPSATGTLGQSAPSAATNTVVYTVSSSLSGVTAATVTINVCNRGNTSATVRLAISDATTPQNKDYIEYDATVPAFGVLERTGVVMSSDKKLIAYCSTANFSINVYGFEE